MRYALCAMRPPSSLPSIFLLSAPLAPRPFGALARTDREPAVSLSHSLSRPLAAGRATDADGALSLPSFLPYSIVRGLGAFAALDAHCNAVDYSRVPQPASQPPSPSLAIDEGTRGSARSGGLASARYSVRSIALSCCRIGKERRRERGGGGDDDEKEN